MVLSFCGVVVVMGNWSGARPEQFGSGESGRVLRATVPPSLPPFFNFCIDLLRVLGFDHDDHDRI